MSNKQKEEARSALRDWVESQLMVFSTPRHIDIQEKGSELGLTKAESIRYIKSQFPAIAETGRPKFALPRHNYRTYVKSFYHTVACDVAFFGRQSQALRNLQISQTERNGCFVMKVLGSQFAIAEPLGPKGKSAEGLTKALRVCFERYKAQFDIYPMTLLMDDEKGMSSKQVSEFLKEKNTKLFIYKFSRKKSLMAENLIRNMRQSFATLRKKPSLNANSWVKMLPKVVKSYNERPLIIYGKKIPMSPKEITPENWHKFQNILNKTFKFYSIVSFSLDPKLFKYKFPIGSRVYIKKRAIQLPSLGDKWSENPLDRSRIWIVKKRAAHISKQRKVVKTVFLKSENDGAVTQQEEEALVYVDQPL